MLIRPFTLPERIQLVLLAGRLEKLDAELARLVTRLAWDDSVLPAVHERLAICGRLDVAEKVRVLVCE